MIPRYLDKRTYDDRLYDINCTDLLDDAEVIVQDADQPITITADPQDAVNGAPLPIQSGLLFGDISINPAPINYPKLGSTAPIGKAIQFIIEGGVIPQGASCLFCVIRARFSTNQNRQLEATLLLRLIDTP